MQVRGLRVDIGKSNIEASGTLKDAKGSGSLAFRSQFAVGELGRLFKVASPPNDIVAMNGNARINGRNVFLDDLHVAGFGAEVDGNASLEDFARYKLNIDLRALDIETALRAMNERLPYQGVVSGTLAGAAIQKNLAQRA